MIFLCREVTFTLMTVSFVFIDETLLSLLAACSRYLCNNVRQLQTIGNIYIITWECNMDPAHLQEESLKSIHNIIFNQQMIHFLRLSFPLKVAVRKSMSLSIQEKKLHTIFSKGTDMLRCEIKLTQENICCVKCMYIWKGL